MSGERYEIEDTCPGVVGVKLGDNTWYLDDEQPEAGAIRQQSRDIAELRAELAAAVGERDELRADHARIVTEKFDALIERNQLRARLAAIDNAPTVLTVIDANDGGRGIRVMVDTAPPIGTELIARPAKD